MADELHEVQPGDLITADFMNALIRAVKNLSTGPGGGVSVPNLFGRTLRDAKTVLAAAGSQLSLGVVVDAFGLVVNPSDATNDLRMVINQTPPAGTVAFSGSSVALVLAAKPSAGQAPANPPTITQIVRANSSPPETTIPAGTEMQIIGQDFDVVSGNNIVKLNEVALPPPSAASTRFVLYVQVPTAGIPGFPPTGPMQVNVTVTTPAGGTSQARQATISPPQATPTPQITGITPNPGVLGNTITITGNNFGLATAGVSVLFSISLGGNPIIAQPGNVQPTSITVTVPEISQVRNSEFPVTIQIQVRIAGETTVTSSAFPHAISRS